MSPARLARGSCPVSVAKWISSVELALVMKMRANLSFPSIDIEEGPIPCALSIYREWYCSTMRKGYAPKSVTCQDCSSITTPIT
ncbi:unnamed protein product [Haemonchus placei]|uniref:Uncharacterized protein n=1 Tax=Haemonchus placei TaxID=6290 RepID=A0A3P7ZVU9_HAEPC|nr:unnamed protein product [Haemonchus placei]